MSERIFYCICQDNCKFETLNREQILTAITQAVETGEIQNVNTGFVTTVKEANHNTGLSFWVGTQAEYDALETTERNRFYIITDDTSFADMQAQLSNMAVQVAEKRVIDVSDIVEFENVTNGNKVTLNSKSYKYDKELNAVFFELEFTANETIPANTVIVFKHKNGYGNLSQYVAVNAVAQNGRKPINAEYAKHTGKPAFRMFVTQEVNNGEQIEINGWYTVGDN